MKLQFFSPALIKLNAKYTGLSVRPPVRTGQVLDIVGVFERTVLYYILVMINAQAAALSNPPPRCDGSGDVQSFSLTDWKAGIELWIVGTHDVTSPTEFVQPETCTRLDHRGSHINIGESMP